MVNENDCRTTIACGSISGSEPLANSSFCSKPEDEMEKLSHRSNSSLGVVSNFFSKNNGLGALKIDHRLYIQYTCILKSYTLDTTNCMYF